MTDAQLRQKLGRPLTSDDNYPLRGFQQFQKDLCEEDWNRGFWGKVKAIVARYFV